MPYIYKITSPTGKIYIGSTINSVNGRWKHYKTLNCKSQRKLYSSFLKHGVNAHVFSVICETSFENMLSTEYIVGMQYDVLSKNGVNLALPNLFGNSILVTDEARKNMSDAQKGEKSHMFGKDKSAETRERLSEAHKGKKLSDKTKEKIRQVHIGKKLTDEHKLKISNSNKGKQNTLGKKLSEETKNKMRVLMKGEGNNFYGKKHTEEAKQRMSEKRSLLYSRSNHPQAKKVICTVTNKIYGCAKEAAIDHNIIYGTLISKLNGKIKNNTSLIYF